MTIKRIPERPRAIVVGWYDNVSSVQIEWMTHSKKSDQYTTFYCDEEAADKLARRWAAKYNCPIRH